MTKLRLFALTLSITTGVLLVVIFINRPRYPRNPKLVRVGNDLYITSQLFPQHVPILKRRGIVTIVDIRPDTEVSAQESSSEIESASKQSGIGFHYIPVPHEDIPDAAVTALGEVLSHHATPAVLYCRTGRRAVRTFALAEASRADGPSAETIVETVRATGFSADDLQKNIAQRIAHRSGIPTGTN